MSRWVIFLLSITIVIALRGAGFPDFEVQQPWLGSSLFLLIVAVMITISEWFRKDMPHNLSLEEEAHWKYNQGVFHLKLMLMMVIPIFLAVVYLPSFIPEDYMILLKGCIYLVIGTYFLMLYGLLRPKLAFTTWYPALQMALGNCSLICALVLIALFATLYSNSNWSKLFFEYVFIGVLFGSSRIDYYKHSRVHERTLDSMLISIGPNLGRIISDFEAEGKYSLAQIESLQEIDQEKYPVLKERKLETYINTYHPRSITLELVFTLLLFLLFVMVLTNFYPHMESVWSLIDT